MHSSVSLVLATILLVSGAAPASGVATQPTHIGESTTAQVSTPAPATDAPADGALPESDDACAALSTGSETPNPDEDVLGWENGCWHNATVHVDREDGLNDTELAAVVARTMARVELVRQLEFDRTVPVEVISREEYANRTAGQFEATSSTERLRTNVEWEAVMMVDERTDAVSVQRSNTVAGVGGFYSLADDRIILVSDDATDPKIDEHTLAHELTHALQNQQFDVADRFGVSNFDAGNYTTETLNALNGLLEGDASLVEMRYGDRCGEEWDCLSSPPENAGTGDRHEGMYFVNIQPYSDGPKFVNAIYEERGWDGVDEVYRNPPASTDQVINPEKYPDENPANLNFTDRSRGDWRILAGDDGPRHLSFGMPGVTSMFVYPLYDEGEADAPVMPARIFFNSTPQGLSTYDPFKYENNPFASGWNGDELYPYVKGDSTDVNETGYVWTLAWDAETNASTFVDGYLDLLDYHNATAVKGHENTYRIPEGDRFADAYYVEQSGDTVTIVNAPSVADLSQVRSGAAPEVERTTNGTQSDNATGLPGFGVLPALAALVGLLGLLGLGGLLGSGRIASRRD